MSSRGSTNASINNSPNVKGTSLIGLISKPVAEAKKQQQKNEEMKASLILKH